MRTMALWFPDWSAQALIWQQQVDRQAAIILEKNKQVFVANAGARQGGVRRGMTVRHAQALIPAAVVISYDEERDGSLFAKLIAELEQVVATIEILRPGLAVVDAHAAGRYHGGEEQATEIMIDAVATAGIDCLIGVADEVDTAIIAARRQAIVPHGGSKDFLWQQATAVLRQEPALGCDEEVVRTLEQLGLVTLGDVASLSSRQISTRFGATGTTCHAVATASRARLVSPALLKDELTVSATPEEPLRRVDQAAFLGRKLAAQLHQRLREEGLSCTRLKIRAVLQAPDQVLERVWASGQLSEQASADRVRWQLQAWLSEGGAGELVELALVPVECQAPASKSLWGREENQQLQRVVTRVQASLGMDRVCTPIAVGGRGANRIELIPFGEQGEGKPRQWRGAVPAPLPARLAHPASKVSLFDATGHPIYVTQDVTLNSEPAVMRWGSKEYQVAAWAGPWPADENWWLGGQPVARLQLVGKQKQQPHAWLLLWVQEHWRIEASYD